MNTSTIEGLAERVANLKGEQSRISAEFKQAEAELFEEMASDEVDEVLVGSLGKVVKRIDSSVAVLNEAILRKKLSTEQWAEVTSQTLDLDRLEAAVTLGHVDPEIVATATEMNSRKPYIKISKAR